MFLNNRAMAAIKTEAVPYTAETLVSADMNLRIKNDITFSPEIMEYKRKILKGDFDQDSAVMGRQTGTVSFTVDLAPGTTSADVPAWAKLLTACGFKQTTFTTTGVSWVPNSGYTHNPCTIEFIELEEGASPRQLVTRMAGCVGNVTFSIGTVGEPVQMKFELKGRLLSIFDRPFANMLVPTSMSTVIPPAVMGATVYINSVEQDIDKFEIATGNDVQQWIDPSNTTGVKGFYIAGRESTLKLDPTGKMMVSDAVYANWVAGTTGFPFTITLGSTIPLRLSAMKSQYSSVSYADRNGARVHEKNFLLLRNAGEDTLEILQGSKA